jgi:hypothetical protein
MTPVFDAVASGSAGAYGGFVANVTHTATPGATVLAFVNVGSGRSLSPVTYGGQLMAPVGTVSYHIDTTLDGILALYALAGAPGGPQTVSAPVSGLCLEVLATVSYTGVSSVGAPWAAADIGTSASQSITCGADQVIVQGFASQTAIVSAPTGGTNRAVVKTGTNIGVDLLSVSDSTGPATFGATLTSISPYGASWGAIGVVLS